MESKIYHGKDINEAIENACSDLSVARDQIQVDVVDPGKRGFLGFGRKEATIKVKLLKDVIASISETEPLETEVVDVPPFSAKDQAAVDIVKKMLADLFKEAKITATINYRLSKDQIIFEIDSDEYKGLIIGKKGKTINSLQSIAQTIYTHHAEHRYYMILDIDNYRDVRQKQINDWLNQAISTVRSTGKIYCFSPMIAVERRFIVNRLSNVDDIGFRVRGSFPRKYVEIFQKS